MKQGYFKRDEVEGEGIQQLAVARTLTEEEQDGLLEFCGDGIRLIGLPGNMEPVKRADQVMQYVDKLLEEKLTDNQKIGELAISLGTLWGYAVAEEYEWNWMVLEDQEKGYQGFYLVSPSERFCCPVYQYFFKIISGQNLIRGENDNTILLLFNMISKIEEESWSGKYNIIW